MSLIDNQLFCMEYFRDNLDLTDYQCAALVGCITAENTKTNNHGVGIMKWKSYDIKEKALSLNDQLKIIVEEIKNGLYKDNFGNVIHKCNTLKDAVAAVYCRFTNGYSSKNTIPTNSDINRINKNNSMNEFNIRLKYANEILEKYHNSIDI